jgi:hypothetical protein
VGFKEKNGALIFDLLKGSVICAGSDCRKQDKLFGGLEGGGMLGNEEKVPQKRWSAHTRMKVQVQGQHLWGTQQGGPD